MLSLSQIFIRGSKMKSKTTAILLCVFLGGIGGHRFYLGYTLYGIIQLCTGGGLMIWAIIDLVRLAQGNLLDYDGNELV